MDINGTTMDDEATTTNTSSNTQLRPTCDDVTDFFNFKINIYLLPVSVVYIAALSMLIKRKRTKLSCCWGRPGVLYPLNLLDEDQHRWFYVVCFIMFSRTIVGLFSGDTIYDPVPHDDKGWMEKFGWVSVFVKLLNVIMVCVIYYPIFACASLHKLIAANIAGIVYVIVLIARECIIIVGCSRTGMDAMDIGTNVIYWIPMLIALTIYIFTSFIELLKNVQQFRQQKQTFQVLDYATTNGKESHFQTYVKALLLRHKHKKPTPDEPTTISGKIRKTITDLVEHFKYENVPGFRYPLRVICTLAVAGIVVLWLVIKFGIIIDTAFSLLDSLISLDIIMNTLLSFGINEDTLEKIIDYIRIMRIVAAVSNATAGILQLVYLFHMLIIYKRRTLKLYHGDRSWHVKLQAPPSSQLVGGMQYSGYQIAFIIYGWVFTTIMLFVVLTLASLLVFVPVRDRTTNFIIDKLKQLWPVLVISFLINYGEGLMCKHFFLQGNGEVLALNNRSLYHVMSFFLFIFNVIIGAFAGIKRIILSLIIGAFRLGRLDHVLIMRGFEKLDSGHMAYLAMINVQMTNNHPVLRTFIEVLKEVHQERQLLSRPGISEAERLRKYRIKMKWWKSVTMINNPTIVLERIQRFYRTKQNNRFDVGMGSTTENENLKHQNSIQFLMMTANNQAMAMTNQHSDDLPLISGGRTYGAMEFREPTGRRGPNE